MSRVRFFRRATGSEESINLRDGVLQVLVSNSRASSTLVSSPHLKQLMASFLRSYIGSFTRLCTVRSKSLSSQHLHLSSRLHYQSSNMAKSRVLVVGTGGIGTMSAYALENGGLAEVTAVMRSNYDAAVKDGIDIDSVQYGQIKAWRPTASTWKHMRYDSFLLTCPSHQDCSRCFQGRRRTL